MNLSCVCVRARWQLCNSIEILTTNYRNIQQQKRFFVQCHWRVIVVIFECEKPFLWLLIIMITLRTICCCYARFPWTEPDKYCLNCSTDCVEIPAIRRNSEWWDDRTHHRFRSEYGNAYRVQKHESINRCTRVWWNCVASFYHHRILLFFFFYQCSNFTHYWAYNYASGCVRIGSGLRLVAWSTLMPAGTDC